MAKFYPAWQERNNGFMENENKKWEYDYSTLYGTPQQPADTGYVNVGSSGTNAANRYNTADGTAWTQSTTPPPQPEPAGTTGYAGSYYGTTPPPRPRAGDTGSK